MSDSNGSPHLEAEPTMVEARLATTADDEARPYQHVTMIGVARGGNGYYLVFGHDVPASSWAADQSKAIVRLVAKLYLTPSVLEQLASILQDVIKAKDDSGEGE